MGIIALIQIAVSIAMFVALLLTLSVAGETKYSSLYFFAGALFLLSGWTYLHFLANEYQVSFFYLLGNFLGFLSLVFITFFVTYSEYETFFNLKNTISIVFFTAIVTYMFSVPSMFVFYFSTTSDYVLLAVSYSYNAMQLLFLSYVGFVFTYFNIKIIRKVRNTHHTKYAVLLLISGFVSVFVFNIIILMRLALVRLNINIPFFTLESLLILYYLSTFLGASLIIIALLKDSCIFCILPINVYRLFVFYKGGIPIFSYRFKGAKGASDALSIGAISGIETILSEIIGAKEEIRYIALKKHVIILKSFRDLVFVLIAENPTKIVVRLFGEFVKAFVETVGSSISIEHGKVKVPLEKFEKILPLINKIFLAQHI